MSADSRPSEDVSGATLVATARAWMARQATPAEQHELAPLLDTYETLLRNAATQTAARAAMPLARSAEDAEHLAELTRVTERTAETLTQQRRAIHNWMAEHLAGEYDADAGR